ncbi:hypothetical protein Cst_c25370 [Thermoclostridium stercorarium subsp. stercorarium DSM 8532]|jgi:Mg/Co/Ni transporter MgtE|uniref:Uncharacterized protein n=3 Tax=Thermoclostridium stercorarium TaxID=1510 RepID=L7VS66_THES1|nr:hypothetical protein [Thermoclostridium stercorarium]AGC69494.1 hypothetical protein Cst_c25370 [Thermoclostridium stercorarium subsp. stercorarium DSM 8532]AGI40447.1 hypothetical protein Clst_2427 [Thermoclostridium stercorarium subsp. stercorarium DSM 8532]ANW99734.1 hypothetical protein CSTERTH_12155 [Thermoclostridium stercorarium subsp. thermolacticum DSM 2910]ANX02360.1 hypothetical protein CSTERLE_12645 [Thermoclostridium stercorarium subsp. leptospartum DSM 9219]UZQ85439.1 hypothet
MNDFSNYLHGQITRKKIEKGIEMLRNESAAELRKKLQSVNIDEALKKLDEYDKNRLRELGINISEYRNRITEADIQKIYQVLGRDGEKVIRKLRELLR